MAGFVCLRCGKLVASTARTPNSVTFVTNLERRRLPLLNLTNKEIRQLPPVEHGGTNRQIVISHPTHEARFKKYVKVLAQNKVLGFDTESKPVFSPKARLKPCLVQLASPKLSVLWRLRTLNSSNGRFPMLCSILESKEILKVCRVAVVALVLSHTYTRAHGLVLFHLLQINFNCVISPTH